jgi:hypothetical protein
MVENLLKPLLKPIDSEREAKQAADRAGYVIERVVKHLSCLKSYYMFEFLSYITDLSKGYAMADALKQALDLPGANVAANILDFFDLKSGFLDGLQFVVPFRERFELQDVVAFISIVTGREEEEIGSFKMTSDNLIVPTDGIHIEPVAGSCILAELPPLASSLNADIRITGSNLDQTS